MCAPLQLLVFELKLAKDVVVGPSTTHAPTINVALWTHGTATWSQHPFPNLTLPHNAQRKRVRKPVTQSESDTNDTGSSDDDNTGTGTDSSDDHNTGTGTDSSDTGTDTDDCPLSHVVQEKEKNIHVGVSIAKYFDDELYFGHIHALPKSGEKHYEIVYNDGDEETMTHTQVLKALHTYYHYQKTK